MTLSSVQALYYDSVDVTQGQSYWSMNGTGTDEWGGNTMTSVAYTTGIIDQGGDFGYPTYATVSPFSDMKSLSFWFKLDSPVVVNTNRQVLMQPNESTTYSFINLGAITGHYADEMFVIYTPTGSYYWTDTDIGFSTWTTAWHSIVLSWNSSSSNYLLYINGSGVGHATKYSFPGEIDEWPDPIFGRRTAASQYVEGVLDEIAYWNYSLDDNEVAAIYNHQVAGYRLDYNNSPNRPAYNNSFTLNNTVNSAGSQTTLYDGAQNQNAYAYFDNSEHIQLADNYVNDSEFILSFWANIKNSSDAYDYFFVSYNTTWDCGFRVRTGASAGGVDRFQVNLFNGSDFLEQSDSGYVGLDEWHMYTLKFYNDSGVYSLDWFKDGVQYGATDTVTGFMKVCHSSIDTWIGSSDSGLNEMYGSLDDLLIFNTNLSDAEILSIYTRGRSVRPTDPLGIADTTSNLFVDSLNPQCNDTYTRSQALDPGTPWCSLEAPLTDDKLSSGDTLFIREGEYNLSVDITGWTISSNITITAYPGDNPTLTAYEAGQTWTQIGATNEWHTTESNNQRPRVYLQNNTKFFTFLDRTNMLDRNYSYASWRNSSSTSDIHVDIDNGDNPNTLNPRLATFDQILYIDSNTISNNAYLILENLTFTYIGVKGLHIHDTSNVIVDNCSFFGGHHAIYIDGSDSSLYKNIEIMNSYFDGKVEYNGWYGEDCKNEAEETDQIKGVDFNGRVYVHHNTFYDVMGSILLYADDSEEFNGSEVSYNNISHAKGSSLEIEDYCYNSSWHHNKIFDSQYAGVSWSPADASHSPTPCQFYNNEISINQTTYWSASNPTLNSYAIKGENRSINKGMDNWYVNHNTFYAQGTAMNGINTGWVQNTTWTNNIFNGKDVYAIYRSGLASQNSRYDYNIYWNGNATNLLQRWNTWDATGYTTLASALASGDWDGTWDLNSIEANPLFNDENTNLTPLYPSPACNNGQYGSDIGAVVCPYDAPTIPTSLVFNQNFSITNHLVANASGSTDLNNDTITYYYKFYNFDDSQLLRDYSTNNTYVLQTTDMFDRIFVQAIASDGVFNTTSILITASPALVYIYAYNNFTGELIDNLQVLTDYNNYSKDSGDNIYMNYGVYNVTIAATHYSNSTVEKNITNTSVATNITVYLAQHQTFYIYDEETGLPFNTNETNSTTVSYHCSDTIISYDFNTSANENSAFLPVECAWGFIKLDMDYSGTTYYRTLSPDSSATSVNFYMIDLDEYTGVQVIFELNDLVGEFADGYLILERPVNDSNVVIHKQTFDAENRVVTYLLKDGYYTLKLETADGATVRSIGYVIAEAAGTKTLTIPDIDFVPDSYIGDQIRYSWSDSTSSQIRLQYVDDSSSGTTSLTFSVYNTSDDSLIYSTSDTNVSSASYIYNTPTENSSYLVCLNGTHPGAGEIYDCHIISGEGQLPDMTGFDTDEEYQLKKWTSLIICMIVLLGVGYFHITAGMGLFTFFLWFFIHFDWLTFGSNTSDYGVLSILTFITILVYWLEGNRR